MASSWVAFKGCGRPLLIRGDYGQTDYSLYLTDLTDVWTERMDRKGILRRALNTDASIDPSEDSSQMRLLLSSIKKAIGHEPGSNAEISSSDQGASLTLLLIVSLSTPLADLRWECTLAKLPQSSMTSQIMMPLLTTRLHARTESRLLLAQVQQKDTVIAKLMSQMQADGSDFGKIFPGAIAARRSQKSNLRDELGRSVPGLARFSEEALQKDVSAKMEQTRTFAQVVSASCPITISKDFELENVPEKSNWWDAPRHIGHEATFISNTEQSAIIKKRQPGAAKIRSPPRIKQADVDPIGTDRESRAQAGKVADDVDDDSTTDESDDETAAVRPNQPMNREDEPSSPNAKVSGLEQRDDLAQGSSTHDTLRSQSPIGAPSAPSIPVAKPKSRLGKIGGKKNLQNIPMDVAPASAKNPDSTSDAKPSVERPETASKQSQKDLVSRSRKTEASKEVVDMNRETSQERADRNREKLKRELDKKDAGGKKKRKF